MAILVKLQDVVDALELPDEWQALLDPDTGEIITITDEEQDYAEDASLDPSELPDWEREAVARAQRAVNSERMLSLPDKFDVHEWDMMRRFAYSLEQPQSGEILEAIHGSGAFRLFRVTTERLGLRDAWFRYREDRLKQIARDWLEAHGIAYTEA
jgi:hypothetical protein